MVVSRPLAEQLARRARTGGGSALLTHYGPQPGQRTELSATAFANWVDKTANLLDAIGADADADVTLPVLLEAPAHWMGLVWPFALWQRGVTARVVARKDAAAADLAVVGPDAPAPLAADTLACSLHPWGRALEDLPPGVTDYSSEALAQPDVHVAVPVDPQASAWIDADRDVSFAGLLDLPAIGDRVLARPAHAWAAVTLLVGAILGGGSVVLVEGDVDEEAIARQERARVVVA